MRHDTLIKANNLEQRISECGDLLRSRKANYSRMLIKISCANSNSYDDYYGRLDKEVWDKLLDVVEQERQKTKQELADLSDDTCAVTAVKQETASDEEQSEKLAKRKHSAMRNWFYALLMCVLVVGVVAGLVFLVSKALGLSFRLDVVAFGMAFTVIWELCYYEISGHPVSRHTDKQED